ncbi:hypothetical protein E2C01_090505 [Portunus trituberculatus]|uniref:Uncharacterized protein n=1 Tax=Portunus trituberculatus TaxID=210409 RepID=A0A5B7JBK6_PORTR|nr:hypothetical protein [Portunus trituberculatus]
MSALDKQVYAKRFGVAETAHVLVILYIVRLDRAVAQTCLLLEHRLHGVQGRTRQRHRLPGALVSCNDMEPRGDLGAMPGEIWVTASASRT